MRNPSLLKIRSDDKITILTWNVRKGIIEHLMHKKNIFQNSINIKFMELGSLVVAI